MPRAASAPTAVGQRWARAAGAERVVIARPRLTCRYPVGVFGGACLESCERMSDPTVPGGRSSRTTTPSCSTSPASRPRWRWPPSSAPSRATTSACSTPGGGPVTAQPGLRLEAHGALERHTGAVDTLVVSAATGTGGRQATTCSSRTSGGWPATRGGWRRCARAPPCWRRRACSTGAGPPRTGRTPTAWPATTRRSPSTPIRSSCGTAGRDVGGRHERVGPHAVVRRGGPRPRGGAAGGPRARHLHAAAGHAGTDEPARRGTRARPRRGAGGGRARRTAPRRRPLDVRPRRPRGGQRAAPRAGCSARTWGAAPPSTCGAPAPRPPRPSSRTPTCRWPASPTGAASARPRPCARPSSTRSATRLGPPPRPRSARRLP